MKPSFARHPFGAQSHWRIVDRALLLAIFVASCSNCQVQLNSMSRDSINKVKSKKRYSTMLSTQVLATDEFEYDSTGRLTKQTQYNGNKEMLIEYDVFRYDPAGRLIVKLGYHGNLYSPTGYNLQDSTEYFYVGTLLASEKTTYPMAHYADSCSYEYENQHLKRCSKYSRGRLESYTEYDYEDGQVKSETLHGPDELVHQTILHQRKDGLLSHSCYYNFRGILSRTIRYTYDIAGRVILESVEEELLYSNSTSYIMRYEY